MSFEIIQNNGPDNLRDTLNHQLKRSSEVFIAVAFLTQAGLDKILQSLREVAAEGQVRFLTGLYQGVTEPQALQTLLRIQRETRGQFAVRLSKEPKFHRKLYLLGDKTHSTAIIGSSNLTREGLTSGGELNLMVHLPKDSVHAKKFTQPFEHDWNNASVPLVAEQIKEYEKVLPRQARRGWITTRQLEKILRAAPAHTHATSDSANPKVYWRDYISGEASKRTGQVISETTNWDNKNYSWYSNPRKHSSNIGDQVFLFSVPDKNFRLVEVKTSTRTPYPTPDGRHFVAYKPLGKFKRRFSKLLWNTLRAEGITKKNAQRRLKVGSKQADRLMAILRVAKGKR